MILRARGDGGDDLKKDGPDSVRAPKSKHIKQGLPNNALRQNKQWPKHIKEALFTNTSAIFEGSRKENGNYGIYAEFQVAFQSYGRSLGALMLRGRIIPTILGGPFYL